MQSASILVMLMDELFSIIGFLPPASFHSVVGNFRPQPKRPFFFVLHKHKYLAFFHYTVLVSFLLINFIFRFWVDFVPVSTDYKQH